MRTRASTDLIAATLRGETTREIRSRIAETKSPSNGKQGRGSTTAAGKFMLGLSESSGECTAIVRGPEGESTREHMRTAVEKLLKQL